MFGPLIFVYYVDNKNKFINITIRCFFGICLHKYYSGNYYCRIYDADKTNHLTHKGYLKDLFELQIPHKIISVKRKNIILLYNNEVINTDLNILDNYVKTMIKLKKDFFDIKLILKCFGIKCSHIQFLSFQPFKKEILPINDVNVLDLYDNIKSEFDNPQKLKK